MVRKRPNPKRERRLRARAVSKFAEAAKLEEFGQRLGRLQMDVVAKEIVEKMRLPKSELGRNILRLELQRGLFKSIGNNAERQGRKISSREALCMRAVENAGKIESVLRRYGNSGIPLKEAYEMYSASANIIRDMEIAAKGDRAIRDGFGLTGRNIDAAASQLKRELDRGNAGRVSPGSKKDLLQIAENSQDIIEFFCNQLPEFDRLGLEAVEKIVDNALPGRTA